MNLKETTYWMNLYHDSLVEAHNTLIILEQILKERNNNEEEMVG